VSCIFCPIKSFITITLELLDQAFSFFFLSQSLSPKLFHSSFYHSHFLLSSTFFVSPSPFFASIFQILSCLKQCIDIFISFVLEVVSLVANLYES
jgi:hypothetical protein